MSLATLAGEHKDITGERFGRLVAIEYAPILSAKGKLISHWKCQCDCGTIVTVRTSNLRCGNTSSCGCLYKEAIDRRKNLKRKFPSEYNTWSGMKGRCNTKTNGSYPDYGGRGIRVCKTWEQSFEQFLADVGPKPAPGMQLDRINNDGNYELGNVRWATPAVQNRNKRNNVFITINGETKCLADWAVQLNVPSDRVEQRVRSLGWDPVRAVTTPKLSSRNDPRSPTKDKKAA